MHAFLVVSGRHGTAAVALGWQINRVASELAIPCGLAVQWWWRMCHGRGRKLAGCLANQGHLLACVFAPWNVLSCAFQWSSSCCHKQHPARSWRLTVRQRMLLILSDDLGNSRRVQRGVWRSFGTGSVLGRGSVGCEWSEVPPSRFIVFSFKSQLMPWPLYRCLPACLPSCLPAAASAADTIS